MAARSLTGTLKEARACTVCSEHLPLGPRPIVRAHKQSRILLVGQAPGTRVHNTGVPWNDPSGDRLRAWLNIDKEIFYDESIFAIVPMGFCYPGRDQRGGDAPPRPECAPLWHAKLRKYMPDIQLTILIGKYAQAYYLEDRVKKTLGDTVKAYREYGEGIMVLPHPSPRNTMWLKKNPWYEKQIVPELRRRVRALL
ncbi:MAG: uracil-DNA glycosylase family protein [bacterium]|nr:uracil-DNA glycosylase family protein [bacterium]